MAIEVNGKFYRTLADEFFLDHDCTIKVYKALVNGVQVYPEEEPEPEDVFEHDGFRFMALQKSYLIYDQSYKDDFSDPFYSPQWICTPSIAVRNSTGQDVFVCLESSLNPFIVIEPDHYANVSLLVSQYGGYLYLIMLDKSATSKHAGVDLAVIGSGVHRNILEANAGSNTCSMYGQTVATPISGVPESERPIETSSSDIEAYIQWLLTQDVPQIGEV